MDCVYLAVLIALTMSSSEPADCLNLEYWMTELPAPLKDVPLIYLAIPGSHDSMSYGITRSSSVSPDAPAVLRRLYPVFRGTMTRWSVTQAADVTQQLMLGIRYFDLRIATKEGTDKFYFCHALYADEITKPLTEIKEFLDAHPHEVVILDFQHFYQFTVSHHHVLISALVNMFGPRLCPQPARADSVTLNALNRLHRQLVVVYRDGTVQLTERLWRAAYLPTLWPRQDSTQGLLAFLTAVRRQPGLGFVHQAVLTPSTTFILLRLTSSLREKCAIPVEKRVLPKLEDFSPGIPNVQGPNSTLNIAIADFVEMSEGVFPRTIITLNFKLLKNADKFFNDFGGGTYSQNYG